MAAVSPGREVLEYAKLRSDLVYYGPASNRNKREIYIERGGCREWESFQKV